MKGLFGLLTYEVIAKQKTIGNMLLIESEKDLEEISADYPLGGTIEPYDMAMEDELVRSQEGLDYKLK
jgi:hypothetical protein